MTDSLNDPRHKYRSSGYPAQTGTQPGTVDETSPAPDHGEDSYRGTGRLTGRRALITGGDSGIGRAVAIAYAREGADVAISYLSEEAADAERTAELIEQAGRKAVLLPADITNETASEEVVRQAAGQLGGLDILVLNAAYQRNRPADAAFSTAEFDRVMRTNLYAPFWMIRTALPMLQPGAAVIVTTSVQAASPSPALLDYAMTKAALAAFVTALAEQQGPEGIRVNGVAPGPIWTPLIPATDWPDKLPQFGQDTPLGRAGQPAELAGAYVYLASDEASYVAGAILPVTGGKGM